MNEIIQSSHAPFLFHHPHFVFRETGHGVIEFSINSDVLIYFSLENGTLFSLPKSSFGGLVFKKSVSKDEASQLLKHVEEWAGNNSVTTVTIRNYPEIFDPQQSAEIAKVLLENDYQILYSDVGQVILINENQLTTWSTIRKRMLRKCFDSKFSFSALDRINVKECYDLIVESRKKKGYTVSMTLPQLEVTLNQFPDNYFLFGVYDRKLLIAAAVVVKVSSEVWYTFYFGDHLGYRKYSPVTLLIKGIYDQAKESGAKILDLGTSSDKGILDLGVYNFKKSFGSQSTNRYTFIKRI